jgi:hypothetical protein
MSIDIFSPEILRKNWTVKESHQKKDAEVTEFKSILKKTLEEKTSNFTPLFEELELSNKKEVENTLNTIENLLDTYIFWSKK